MFTVGKKLPSGVVEKPVEVTVQQDAEIKQQLITKVHINYRYERQQMMNWNTTAFLKALSNCSENQRTWL